MTTMTITVPGKNPQTLAEEWTQKTIEFMDRLPNTQQALTDFFYDTGVFGCRNAGDECPFARYLRSQMKPFGVNNVWVARQAVLLNDDTPKTVPSMQARPGTNQIGVPLPAHVREFVSRFDNCLLSDRLYGRLVIG